MTLDTYADLFEADLDVVAERLDKAASAALADSVRTVVPLGESPTVVDDQAEAV